MTRPRLVTSRDCLRCRARTTDAVEHRYHHRRADRRREQYRAAKARRSRLAGSYGSLHDLSCKGPGHCSCVPIPVYREEAA